MFASIKGGKKIDIQGLPCHIPPPGYVYNRLTKKLEASEIITRSHKKADQYWERTPMPDWYEKAMVEVEKKRVFNPLFNDPRCIEYENKEMMRRLNGVWVMMNGVPVYLTGLHYMYLQWWCIDIGYPSYRKPDLEYFYFLQYCIEDPKCMGMCEVTKRRAGKTFRAGLFVYNFTSVMNERVAGIQSKTHDDAKEFFAKAVVGPFTKLPKFMRPIYDMGAGAAPKEELAFFPTNKKGKDSELTFKAKTLRSKINCKNSKKAAYDGQKLHYYVADESGKTDEVSILSRHETIRYCLMDDQSRIIGKALYTTTVEKLETDRTGISDAFKTLWKNSDHTNKKASGRTKSGLYRFFVSAAKFRNFDLYGVPDEALTQAEILAERKEVEDDPIEYAERIRKEPLTIEEAFREDGSKCMFNGVKLNNQRDYLQWNQDGLERGNLVWKDGIRFSRVIWEKNRNGRWLIPKGFKFPDEETNQWEKVGNTFTPKNNYRFGSAVDPYDHDNVVDKHKRSFAASLVKQKNNPNNYSDPFIGSYVLMYKFRQKTAPLMYEDMLKQCFFLGCSILYENNRNGMIRHFDDAGCRSFLMHLPGYPDPGIPSTAANKQMACDFVEDMIENHSSKIPFIDVIDDLLVFDVSDTGKHDLGMAMLWTEVACKNKYFGKPDNSTVTIELSELFPEYEIAI